MPEFNEEVFAWSMERMEEKLGAIFYRNPGVTINPMFSFKEDHVGIGVDSAQWPIPFYYDDLNPER